MNYNLISTRGKKIFSYFTKKFIFFAFVLVLAFQTSFGQEQPIKGIVIDETNTPLEFASVALLKPQDSAMISFAVTGEKGEFEITDSPSGSFLLQIYLTGFLPSYHQIEYKNQIIDLKTVILKTNVEQLNEVTITAVIPFQIKKDTISYNASSFKIHHDDNIEDLLKKLPGVELNDDGTILSQGNEVTKIYVDGKEFFGGDPSIVLKNLPADAINEIEVIDKKSDESELTGVSDDQKNYVINLTLKKTKKRSGFGKLAAGIGLDSKYFSNLNYNKFSPKTQVSVIGKYNNINITGSNIQNFLSANGGFSDDSDTNEENSSFEKKRKSLSGNLTTGVGGVHLGFELKEKEVINADYFYNYLENKGTSQSKRTIFSKANNYQSESDDSKDKTTNNEHLNFNYENKSNKESRLLIKGSYTTDESISYLDRKTSYFNEDHELKNFNDINFNDKRNRDNGNVRLNYYRKLNENRRNFSVGLSLSSNETSSEKDQNNINTNNTNKNKTETSILKNELYNNTNFNFNFNYTEPLGNNHFLKLQSKLVLKNDSETTTQDKTRNGIEQEDLNYRIENEEESIHAKLNYAYNSTKINLNIGSELQHLYRDFGLVDQDPYKKHQAYLNPSMSLRYKPKRGENYSIRYRRYIKSPRNNYSTPVINDINPYYIRKGNPDLKTEKIDNISINTTRHNYKSSLSIFSKLNYQHIQDAIIPSLVISDNYIQTRSFLNEGNQDKIVAEINVNKKIPSLGIRYNFKTKGLYYTAKSIIQSELNDVISKEYLLGLSIENNKKSIFDFKIGANYSVNRTNFSVIEGLDREYIKQHYFSKLDYDLTKKLNFNTQFDYYLYADSNFKSNQRIPFWNASMSYAFTKNNNGILKLVLIDILDKNIDIIRKSTINYFEETTNQTLGRYFILSLTIRLNGSSKPIIKKNRKKMELLGPLK